ncbi:MAG: pitrilysin family protein [Polyangiales bacterium]
MNRILMGTALGVLVAAATLFLGSKAIAEQNTAALSNLQVTRASLENGLRVVMNQDDTVPTVAVSVYYDVGSRNEVEGGSGFAHLFEHMMFQGSANVGKGEHFSLIINRGGSANGTTSNDRTNYYQTLPSNELALGLWLEADRMRSLAITQENFENQRMTVMEERRQRIDNQPYIPSMLRINELAYGEYWPYAHSTIGDMQDLIDAPLGAVQEFFDTFYAPNNAVLSISGDFDAEDAMQVVQKYFGDIPARATPTFAEPAPPAQASERTETMYDANATLPAFHIAYHIPPNRSPDHYALEILALVLGDGESSRLYQSLVKKKEICQDVAIGTDDRRGPDLFSAWAVMASGHAPKEAQDTILAELAAIADKGVTDRELEKAKNRIRAAFVFGLQSNMARSQRLAEFELYWDDANLLKLELDYYLAVSAEDIKRVAGTYFEASNRTVLNVLPGADPASEEK